jgi:hypothetical protein
MILCVKDVHVYSMLKTWILDALTFLKKGFGLSAMVPSISLFWRSMGLECGHELFGMRNRVERFLRCLKGGQ